MAPVRIVLLVVTLMLILVIGRMFWRFLRPIRVVLLEHQRGVLYRNGRLAEVLLPGVYWSTARRQIVPVDVRKQLHQVPGQEILTSDGIAVKVSAVLEYAVTDPMRMMNSSTNFVALVYSQAQLSLRCGRGVEPRWTAWRTRGDLGPAA